MGVGEREHGSMGAWEQGRQAPGRRGRGGNKRTYAWVCGDHLPFRHYLIDLIVNHVVDAQYCPAGGSFCPNDLMALSKNVRCDAASVFITGSANCSALWTMERATQCQQSGPTKFGCCIPIDHFFPCTGITTCKLDVCDVKQVALQSFRAMYFFVSVHDWAWIAQIAIVASTKSDFLSGDSCAAERRRGCLGLGGSADHHPDVQDRSHCVVVDRTEQEHEDRRCCDYHYLLDVHGDRHDDFAARRRYRRPLMDTVPRRVQPASVWKLRALYGPPWRRRWEGAGVPMPVRQWLGWGDVPDCSSLRILAVSGGRRRM